ncbi:TRBP2 protein, partial [Irena cyanogastra]|nr:TRBP2 protein [Irena cyanogastra]
SLEQMVAASPGKTPISLLQEYGTRLGRTPGYDLLKAEGQAHQPNFTFRVTLGDISCTGATPGPPGDHPGPAPSLSSPRGPRDSSCASRALGDLIPILGRLSPFWGRLSSFWGRYPSFGAVVLILGLLSPFRAGDLHSCSPPVGRLTVAVSPRGGRVPVCHPESPQGHPECPSAPVLQAVGRAPSGFGAVGGRVRPRGCPRVPGGVPTPRGGRAGAPGAGQVPKPPGSPPQTCPRLEGLRGRAPGCTWDSLRNSAGEKLGQLR